MRWLATLLILFSYPAFADPPASDYAGTTRVAWQVQLDAKQLSHIVRYFDLARLPYLRREAPSYLILQFLQTPGAFESLPMNVQQQLGAGLDLSPPKLASEIPPPPIRLILPGQPLPPLSRPLTPAELNARAGRLSQLDAERYRQNFAEVVRRWQDIPVARLRHWVNPDFFPEPEKAVLVLHHLEHLRDGNVRGPLRLKKNLPAPIAALFENLQWSVERGRENIFTLRHVNASADSQQLEADREKLARLTQTTHGFNDLNLREGQGVGYRVMVQGPADRDLTSVARAYNHLLLARLAASGRADDALVAKRAGAVVFKRDVTERGLVHLPVPNLLLLRVHVDEPKPVLEELRRWTKLPEAEALAEIQAETNKNLDAKSLAEVEKRNPIAATELQLFGEKELTPAKASELTRRLRGLVPTDHYFLSLSRELRDLLANCGSQLKRLDPTGAILHDVATDILTPQFTRILLGKEPHYYKWDALNRLQLLGVLLRYSPQSVPKELQTAEVLNLFLKTERVGDPGENEAFLQARGTYAGHLAALNPELIPKWIEFLRKSKDGFEVVRSVENSPLGEDPQVLAALETRWQGLSRDRRVQFLTALDTLQPQKPKVAELFWKYFKSTNAPTQSEVIGAAMGPFTFSPGETAVYLPKLQRLAEVATPAARQEMLKIFLDMCEDGRFRAPAWGAVVAFLAQPMFASDWPHVLRDPEVSWPGVVSLMLHSPFGEDAQFAAAIRERANQLRWGKGPLVDALLAAVLEKPTPQWKDLFRATFRDLMPAERRACRERLFRTSPSVENPWPTIMPPMAALLEASPPIERARHFDAFFQTGWWSKFTAAQWEVFLPMLQQPGMRDAFVEAASWTGEGLSAAESLQDYLRAAHPDSPLLRGLPLVPEYSPQYRELEGFCPLRRLWRQIRILSSRK